MKELVHEGNVRRVVIKNEEGSVLLDLPLTIGVVGTVIAPFLAVIGALATLVTRGSIVIERDVETPPAPTTSTPTV